MSKMFFGFELIRPIIHEIKAARHRSTSAAVRTLLDRAEKLIEQVSNRMVHNQLEVVGIRKLHDEANDHVTLALYASQSDAVLVEQLRKLHDRFEEVCNSYYKYAEETKNGR